MKLKSVSVLIKFFLVGSIFSSLLWFVPEIPGHAMETISPSAALSFSDQTIAAGVDVVQASPDYPMARMMGGAAAGDFNNDGWVDLFVIGGGERADALFINQGDGTFEDQAATAGLDELHYGSAAAVGDVNRDGWLDIFVTSLGDPANPSPGKHRLYLNQGDGTFLEGAQAAGINQSSPTIPDGFGAAFGDYDLDGDLDLFITGWMADSLGNRLYQNDGTGKFTEVTQAAGVFDAAVHGFAPCFADMNNDHYPELLVVADFITSRYYVNQQDGTFLDYTDSSGTGQEITGMGNAVGDFDNDGNQDWFVTAIYDVENVGRGGGNKLYINNGDDTYAEIAKAAGVDDGAWGWGTAAVDLDHDGWLDLPETNGWPTPPYTAKPARLWINNGDYTFDEVAAQVGFDHALNGLGLLYFDYDNDGDQDLAVTSHNDAFRLYRNDLISPTHSLDGVSWLKVVAATSDNDALAPNGFGTKIEVQVDGQSYYREINGCSHYLTQSELTAHFGLGNAQQIDRVKVTWQNGTVTTLQDVIPNQTITVEPVVSPPSKQIVYLPFLLRP